MIDLTEINEINRRLEEIVSVVHGDGDVEDILRRRAFALATRSRREAEHEIREEVVVARRGDRMVGFPIRFVKECHRVTMTPIPHATDVVLGVLQIRGELRCLIDLHPLVARESAARRSGSCEFAVTVSSNGNDISVAVDEVIGTRAVRADECAPELVTEEHGIISLVTGDLLSVIDVEVLLSRSEVMLDQMQGAGR